MITVHGMPGPGGSLGKCYACGCTFASSLLTDEPIEAFTCGNVGTFAIHPRCVALAKTWMDAEGNFANVPTWAPLHAAIDEARRQIDVHNAAIDAREGAAVKL